jgi:hypothetical protein
VYQRELRLISIGSSGSLELPLKALSTHYKSDPDLFLRLYNDMGDILEKGGRGSGKKSQAQKKVVLTVTQLELLAPWEKDCV